MDINFQDPSDIPLPPDEVRIRELRAKVLPDQVRIQIFLELTPFQVRPNGEIKVTDDQDREVASISIIEAIDSKMQLTIHLPEGSNGEHTLSTQIYYYPIELFQKGTANEEGETQVDLPSERQVVDSQETKFTVSSPGEAAQPG